MAVLLNATLQNLTLPNPAGGHLTQDPNPDSY